LSSNTHRDFSNFEQFQIDLVRSWKIQKSKLENKSKETRSITFRQSYLNLWNRRPIINNFMYKLLQDYVWKKNLYKKIYDKCSYCLYWEKLKKKLIVITFWLYCINVLITLLLYIYHFSGDIFRFIVQTFLVPIIKVNVKYLSKATLYKQAGHIFNWK